MNSSLHISRSMTMLLLFALVPTAWAQRGGDVQLQDKAPGSAASKYAGQTEPSKPYVLQPGEDPHNELIGPLIHHLVQDQQHFWTAPAHLQTKDLHWILPVVAATGGLIASDKWISQQVPASQVKRSQSVSNYAVYSLIGIGGSSYLWGHLTKNDHLRETGLLAGEAALNSTAVAYAFKNLARRPRPMEGGGNGTFFQGGSSFPSEHSAIAWSIAGVVAHEYPGPLTKMAAYGLATAVSMTRVTGKQHFPTDVVLGGALGWYFAHQVFRAHHEPELGGTAWDIPVERAIEQGPRNPENMSSPYVPPDSWVYPQFERLIALGYVQSAVLGQRPWTRMECARLLEEAEEKIRYSDMESNEVGKIYHALQDEFAEELARLEGAADVGATIDSVYVRGMNISGTPLRDGFHFGQTIINDYGRPYGKGLNGIAGFTAHANAGPLSVNVQGEYQQAPAVPSYSPNVLNAIATVDLTQPIPNGTATVSRFDLLNASVALTFKNTQISFGKQPLWLGPTEAGPLLFSDNAEPVTALQIASVSPYRVPGLSRLFGPVRTEFLIGRLSGSQWVFSPPTLLGPNISDQPFIHADKISFRPTPNLEFGMGITATFGGPGLPVTFGNFYRTYFSHQLNISTNPGKRLSAFDVNYRVPGLRKWLTVYTDALVVDEVSPLGSTRSSLNSGLYMPQVPKIPKLELRFEALNTSHPNANPVVLKPGYVYWDRRYRSGYTNDGQLLGNWIGRMGTGGQAWAKYSFTPRTFFEVGARHANVDRSFLGGGAYTDFSTTANIMLRSNLALSSMLQYENWKFPLLAATPQSNFTASFQLTFYPHWEIRK